MVKPYARERERGASQAFCILICAALPLFALNDRKELGRYARQTWQIESGLPQNTVHAILEAHDGYLWLATEGGLARFDGLNFLVYDTRNTPELRSNNIRSLLEDRRHNLWIGTADGLTRWNGLQFETFTTDQGLPANSIWSMYLDKAGRVWVATAEGLAKYEGHRFTAAADHRAGKISPGNIDSVLTDSAGRTWTATPSGLTVNENGKIATYSTKNGLPSNRVTALYQDRQGSIWVGTDGGLARISRNQIERAPANDSSLNGIILCIFEDREGSLWIGTDSNGLTVLRDEKFTTYTTREGLADDLVRCTFQDRNGRVWIGTNDGLNRFDTQGFSKITTKDGLSSNVILALAEDAAGNLLVGTPDGLNILRDGHVSVLTAANGLADDFVRSIYNDNDDSIWIGTRRGLSHWVNSTLQNYTQADGLGSDFVGTVLRDHRGNLWIGTLHGLTVLRAGKFENYTTKDGLSSDVITALYEDRTGRLWIGTQGGGLNRSDGHKFFRYPPSSGLPAAIYSITEDTNRNLWFTSNIGIFRAHEKELGDFADDGRTSSLTVASYGTSDGLRVAECSGAGHPAASIGKDGSLWFATLRGVATANAREIERNREPPPVVLASVSIDNQTFHPALATDVGPGHSRFAFEYAGLSFLAPRVLRFKYKLEGFDRNWIDAGTRRVAYYTNIPPGTYRFKVTARNNDGVWNEAGATFAFRVRPHFYQTYSFYSLVALGLLVAGWQIYRWRVRQVEAQFKAVLAERNRIAREIHDTLAQGFVAVSVQLELLARIITVSTEGAQGLLNKIRTSVQENLAEARRSIWELRSHGANPDDLPARLSKLATEVTSTTPLKVRFQVAGTYRPLPAHVENELLRIGQEAVANVVRHADARNVNIDLNFEARRLRLAIADDGCGFTNGAAPSGPDGHFGLQGMRERAEQIEAELIVKSAPGEGTRILLEKVIS